jgi:flagellar basal body P-ring formation protein FlgA
MSVNRLTRLVAALWTLWAVHALAQAGVPAAQSPAADAGATHPAAQIREAAEAALRASIDGGLTGVTLEAIALDPRLRLARCAGRLDAFVAPPRPNQPRVPVRVSCPSPAWTLHVPVNIRRSHAVLVMRRAAGRGEQLSAADVTVQTRVLAGLGSPFLSSPNQLERRLTRRPIPEGTAVTADALSAALLIHRGQTITLHARAQGLEVHAPGRALADAAAGQRVRVQNLNSLKIVEGVADSEGVVRVLP